MPEVHEPDLRARGPVRVTLPAAVAYDPARLKESIGSILERIGCGKCCSGADILWQSERDLLLDARAGTIEAKAFDLEESGSFDRKHQFTIGLSPTVKYDINRVFEAVDKVIDILGPHPCISGYDVLFRDELRYVTVNAELEAQRFDQHF